MNDLKLLEASQTELAGAGLAKVKPLVPKALDADDADEDADDSSDDSSDGDDDEVSTQGCGVEGRGDGGNDEAAAGRLMVMAWLRASGRSCAPPTVLARARCAHATRKLARAKSRKPRFTNTHNARPNTRKHPDTTKATWRAETERIPISHAHVHSNKYLRKHAISPRTHNLDNSHTHETHSKYAETPTTNRTTRPSCWPSWSASSRSERRTPPKRQPRRPP